MTAGGAGRRCGRGAGPFRRGGRRSSVVDHRSASCARRCPRPYPRRLSLPPAARPMLRAVRAPDCPGESPRRDCRRPPAIARHSPPFDTLARWSKRIRPTGPTCQKRPAYTFLDRSPH
ncbi:hypothetical protein C7S15_4577 [Burkholderia cepacia]|nr:hypothetical protein [Burkholderia cepacia]